MWHLKETALLAAAMLSVASQPVSGYDLDVHSDDSIKDVSKRMVEDLMSFYTGDKPGQTPGLLPQPYYWWEGGAFFGAMIDYWYYTGDATYNKVTEDALLFQVGPFNDYMPPNQTLTEGNDDQGFWGMAAMTAAEYNFPNPSPDKPQWLALAQAVFNTQAARWDAQNCNGGLRWQIFQWNNGFNYKNSISQACFFNIAARLALYTGNSTYAGWAVKTWDWMVNVNFMQMSDSGAYYVYDGAHTDDNCTTIVKYQFSYNPSAFLLGAAAMYAYTDGLKQSSESDLWRDRVDGLLNGTDIFFYSDDGGPKVMFEVACEGVGLCDVDQQSFKAYLSRWMAATTKWAPWTYNTIKPLMESSAAAAAKQCTGGSNGRMCGLKWANNSGNWDGTIGVGQQMAAMEIVLANMIQKAEAPVTNSTGGTSVGDPSGGGSDIGRTDPMGSIVFAPITSRDQAGAIILTILVLGALLSAIAIMMMDETKPIRENWDSIKASLSVGAGAGAAVLVRKVEAPKADEKGKAVATDRSSTETGEKISSTSGFYNPEQQNGPRKPQQTWTRTASQQQPSRVTSEAAEESPIMATQQRLSSRAAGRRSSLKKSVRVIG